MGRLSENQESGKPPRQKEKKRPGGRYVPPRKAVVCGERGSLQGQDRLTAAEVAVDVVGDEPGLEAAGVAHDLGGAARDIKIFRKHELDAFDQHIAAGGEVMGRDGHGLAPALILHSIFIHLSENGSQGHPLARAYILDGHIHLDDAAQGLQIDIAHVHHHGVRSSLRWSGPPARGTPQD